MSWGDAFRGRIVAGEGEPIQGSFTAFRMTRVGRVLASVRTSNSDSQYGGWSVWWEKLKTFGVIC